MATEMFGNPELILLLAGLGLLLTIVIFRSFKIGRMNHAIFFVPGVVATFASIYSGLGVFSGQLSPIVVMFLLAVPIILILHGLYHFKKNSG